jgi:hypothetical protein
MYSSRNFLAKKELELQDKQKNILKERVLNSVLEDLLVKIKYIHRNGGKDIILEVPKSKIGTPPYNYSECLYFVINKLREQDFYVKFIPINKIYVSWYTTEEISKKIEIDKFIKLEASGFREPSTINKWSSQ